MEEGGSEKDRKHHVVVIGGGMIGSRTVIELSKLNQVQITLIDTRDFYEVAPGAARTLTQPKFHANTTMLHRKWTSGLKNVTFVHATPSYVQFYAKSLAYDSVDGQRVEIDFDFIVLAMGASYPVFRPSPETRTLKQRLGEFRAIHKSISKAGDVVIIGGGSVGVEVAGELASQYSPQQRITLVSAALILPKHPAKARTKAVDKLVQLGVQVLENVAVENASAFSGNDDEQDPLTRFALQHGEKEPLRKVELSNGTTIDADFVLVTTGMGPGGVGKPNTDFISSQEVKLTKSGRVRVKDTLQLPELPNAFAVGDVAATPGEPCYFNAKTQPSVVKKNIKALIKARNKMKLTPFKAGVAYAPLVSVGPNYSILSTSIRVFGSRALTAKKEKDMVLLPKVTRPRKAQSQSQSQSQTPGQS